MRNFKLLLIIFTLFSCGEDCTQTAVATLIKEANTLKIQELKVCHNGQTVICVDQKAVDAHLAHGDYLGECQTLSNGSLVFKEGEVQEISCGYELPYMHIKENGEQWFFTKPE